MKTIILGELPRFALLRHKECVGKLDHYDLVLETERGEEPLEKYETMQEPQDSQFKAEYQRNVRIKYLTFEGRMDDNRGIIQQVDRGIFFIHEDGTITLEGKIVSGRFEVKDKKWIKRVD